MICWQVSFSHDSMDKSEMVRAEVALSHTHTHSLLEVLEVQQHGHQHHKAEAHWHQVARQLHRQHHGVAWNQTHRDRLLTTQTGM